MYLRRMTFAEPSACHTEQESRQRRQSEAEGHLWPALHADVRRRCMPMDDACMRACMCASVKGMAGRREGGVLLAW